MGKKKQNTEGKLSDEDMDKVVGGISGGQAADIETTCSSGNNVDYDSWDSAQYAFDKEKGPLNENQHAQREQVYNIGIANGWLTDGGQRTC